MRDSGGKGSRQEDPRAQQAEIAQFSFLQCGPQNVKFL